MKYILSLLFVSLFLVSNAQELKINVQVNAPRLNTVDPKVFEVLEQDVTEFLNSTKWTEDEYEDFEKIEGNLNITITDELSPTSFTADFYIQTIRPVFNSNYKSQVLNFVDNGVSFSYTEQQPIQNSFNNYRDPLSSLLSYYAYIMIAFDQDVFEPFGGDENFKVAQSVMNAVPPGIAGGTGWDPTLNDQKSRYQVIQNSLDPRMRPFRQAMYEFHMKSLDLMHEDPEKSKAVMLSALTTIEQVNRSYLNSALVQMFADSKSNEILEIYKGSSKGQQKKVYDIMVNIHPAQASKYNDLK